MEDCTIRIYDNAANEVHLLSGPRGGYFSVATVYQRDRCGAVLLAGTFDTVQLWAPHAGCLDFTWSLIGELPRHSSPVTALAVMGVLEAGH